MKYPWYKSLNGESDIQQGDFIPGCPVVKPPSVINQNEEIEIEVQLMDVIILSQSCDLSNKNVEFILVCPYSEAPDFFKLLPPDQTKTPKAKRKILENLRKGHLVAYHLLNKEEAVFDHYPVVDFKNVYSVNRSTLVGTIKNLKTRIRLLSPYREHLSQAFARYFMRVGLPQDIAIEGY